MMWAADHDWCMIVPLALAASTIADSGPASAPPRGCLASRPTLARRPVLVVVEFSNRDIDEQ